MSIIRRGVAAFVMALPIVIDLLAALEASVAPLTVARAGAGSES